MVRFPTGHNAPRPTYNSSKSTVPDKVIHYEDLINTASFSSELSFLLALLLKDGMSQSNTVEMLREIEPFVSDGDKAAIDSILGVIQMTDEFKRSAPYVSSSRPVNGLSDYTRSSRQHSLLNAMVKYAGQGSAGMLKDLQKSIEMQEDYEKTLKQLQSLNNLNSNSPEEMYEALSLFMTPEEQASYRNMQSMMRMMSSMKDLKPEDIMRFMGGMK
jgi:hypothetical protein